MSADFAKMQEVFLVAVERQRPEDRAAYLDQACAGDDTLRRQVNLLLKAHAEAGSVPGASAYESDRTAGYPKAVELSGTVIGPYKLIEQIGEGGMGTVWMAQQTEPVKRIVAVKLIKAGMDSRQIIARFEAERQALALMDHANISRVLDAGTTTAGAPYFVMDLVKGVPITEYCDKHHLTPRQRLELFVPVCQAVQHAHQKGIIHRDLKPSNVLVALYDGNPVPKVIDFGVAKAAGQSLTDKTLVTGFGNIVGTLEYMSPEQAELNQLDIDTRSDIYALGVLLYELLTGGPPFSRKELEKAGMLEMLRVIREQEPSKPSMKLSASDGLPTVAANRSTEPAKLAKLVRGELDWIVMKALEKDRNRRYETANGFAADVQRYLNDEAVQACPPSAAYRVRKFARRYKAALATIVVFVASLLSGITATTWQAVRATKAESTAIQEAENAKEQHTLAKQAARQEAQQRQLAVAQRELAKRNERTAKDQESLARRRYYAAQINLAQQALEAGNMAMALLETQRPKFDEEDPRTLEWYYLWRQCRRGHRFTLQGWKGETRHSSSRGSTQCLAFSPDDRILAAVGWDRYVRLWDLTTGALLATLEGHRTGVTAVAFSPDGRTLASAGDPVLLWDVPTRQVKARLEGHTANIWSLAFSSDGRTLVTGGQDKTVRLWDVATEQSLATLVGHNVPVLFVAFSPDGQSVASASWDSVVKVWDVDTRAERATVHGSHTAVVAFAPDGTLATGGGSLRFWDVQTGSQRPNELNSYGARCLDFSTKGNLLAWGSEDRHVKVYDYATRQIRTHHGRLSPIQCVTFAHDGRTLASAAEDGKIEIWDVFPESESSALKQANVKSVVFSQDGRFIVSASHESAKLVEVATCREIADIAIKPSHSGASCALSTDGKTMAAAGVDGIVRLYDAASGQELAALRGHQMRADGSGRNVFTVAFSPDGKTLASGGQDGTVILWDLTSRQARARLQHASPCNTLAFSPDGQFLATAGHGGETKIWEIPKGKERPVFYDRTLGHKFWLWAAAFSPDGNMLVTGGTSGAVTLWDTETGGLLATLKGHTDVVHSAAFFPDGRTLVTAGNDRTARFWDPATGQVRMTLKNIHRIGIAPDDQKMALASTDGTVEIWHGTEDFEAQANQTELADDNARDPLLQVRAGGYLHAGGRHEESAQSYRQALSRLDNLAAQNPKVPEYRAEQAYVYFALSLVLRATGRSEEADQNQRSGLDIVRSLAADHPDAPDLQAVPLDRLSALRLRLGAAAGADGIRDLGQLMLSIYDSVPSADPGNYVWVLNNQAWHLATAAEPGVRDPQRAVALAKKAVELDPTSAYCANTLGVALYRSADWQGAIDSLESSMRIRQGGDSFDWFFLAMAHWQLGRKDEACKWYEQAALWMTKNNPVNDELNRFREEAAELLRDSPDFSQLLQRLEKTHRAEALAQSDVGSAQENLAARCQAIGLLKELLAARPDELRLRGVLAATLQSTGEIQTGLQQFSDAETSLNEALRIRKELQNQQQNASQGQLDVVSAQVALGQLYVARGRRFAELNRWDRAEEDFTAAVAIHPNDLELLMQRGIIYRELGRLDQAAADFAKVLELVPQDGTGIHPRKRLSAHLAHWPELFDKVVGLRPTDLDLWIGRARYHHLHRRWEDAAAVFARVGESHPDGGESGEYAAVLLLAGDHEGYRELCLRLIENWGESAPAVWAANLARMTALSSNPPVDPSRLIALAERGQALDQAWTRHVLGLAIYRSGDWEAAIRQLEESNQAPWSIPQRQSNELVLAMCEFRLGLVEQAQKRLTKACELLDHATPYSAEKPFEPHAFPFDWPSLNVLRREAEALILRQPDAASPGPALKSIDSNPDPSRTN